MLEVELRGTLSEAEFIMLKDKLIHEADSSRADNKVTYFFVTHGFILKVTQPDGEADAFITVKIGDETVNVLEELDIAIPSESVNDALKLLRSLGFDEVNKVVQRRTNYVLGSFELALKYTDDWGYHFELEGAAANHEEADGVRKQLEKMCREYGLHAMSPEEIRTKIAEINSRHGFRTK